MHLKPIAECQISILIFEKTLWRGGLYKHPIKKYIKDGKVLAHLGFKSKVLPGSLTDLSACVGFCTSSPQQGVKYQLWYLKKKLWRGGLYKYLMNNILCVFFQFLYVVRCFCLRDLINGRLHQYTIHVIITIDGLSYNVDVHCRKISNLFVRALETVRNARLCRAILTVSQRVQKNLMFSDNVHVLFLSCNLFLSILSVEKL